MKTHSILIVDDSEDDRYLLKRQIGKTGLDTEISEVTNGAEALEYILHACESGQDKNCPNIIFLDINMPVLGGWEFLEELLKISDTIDLSSCVITMFSSSDQQDEQEKISHYSFVKGYLVKGSYSLEKLKATIEATQGLS